MERLKDENADLVLERSIRTIIKADVSCEVGHTC